MQNFTLHTHNNELRFDGHASAREMITAAENKGFTTIGVTNHLIMHPTLNFTENEEPMFFHDFNQAQSAYMRHIEILENLKSDFKINIKIGFETDFFQNKDWRNYFEKMITRLPVDYLIGTSHFLKSEDESFLLNIYHLKRLQTPLEDEVLKNYVINHLKNIEQAVRSGYFSFMAHLDYCTIFNLAEDSSYDPYKLKILDALKETGTPFEINTSGYDRINRPHPAPWMIKELSQNGGLVPVVISDDAHYPERLGNHFDKAEALLKELNYTNRLTVDMLKKPC
ncbi:MAG: histidinol-phosphatase HisJ family protein [Alphaproteobacteria bacterium]|nr:histidinol-phosphatase HisJ family protein [Alphaproteobacteria bacterium]